MEKLEELYIVDYIFVHMFMLNACVYVNSCTYVQAC